MPPEVEPPSGAEGSASSQEKPKKLKTSSTLHAVTETDVIISNAIVRTNKRNFFILLRSFGEKIPLFAAAHVVNATRLRLRGLKKNVDFTIENFDLYFGKKLFQFDPSRGYPKITNIHQYNLYYNNICRISQYQKTIKNIIVFLYKTLQSIIVLLYNKIKLSDKNMPDAKNMRRAKNQVLLKH